MLAKEGIISLLDKDHYFPARCDSFIGVTLANLKNSIVTSGDN